GSTHLIARHAAGSRADRLAFARNAAASLAIERGRTPAPALPRPRDPCPCGSRDVHSIDLHSIDLHSIDLHAIVLRSPATCITRQRAMLARAAKNKQKVSICLCITADAFAAQSVTRRSQRRCA